MKKKCQAHVISRNAQCDKSALRWSRYCWWHQPKGLLSVSVILGAVFSLALPEIYHRFVPSREEQALTRTQESINALPADLVQAERRPSFLFFLNGVALPRSKTDPDSPCPHANILLPATHDTQRLRLSVRNDGTLPADKLEVGVQFPSGETGLKKSGNWKDFPGLINVTDKGITPVSHLRCYTTVSQNVIPQNEVYSCHDLLYTKPIASQGSFKVFLTASSIKSDFHALSVTITFRDAVAKPSLLKAMQEEESVQ